MMNKPVFLVLLFLTFALSHAQTSANETCEDALREDVENRCAAVSNLCRSKSLINYYKFIYCTFDFSNYLGVFFAILILAYLFVWLGTAAEKAFCPSLSVISDALKLSQNVAGVTLLALGNGAPDLFSSFTAITNSSPELSFGALMGAGIFVTAIIVGTVAYVSPFTLTRRPFLRDIFFYTFSVAFIFYVLMDGVIELWESFFLIGVYILYVLVVVIGRKIYQSQKAQREKVSLMSEENKPEMSSNNPKYQAIENSDDEDVTEDIIEVSHSDDKFTRRANSLDSHLMRGGFVSRISKRFSRPKSKSVSHTMKFQALSNQGKLTPAFKARISEAFVLGGGSFAGFNDIHSPQKEQESELQRFISIVFPLRESWAESNWFSRILGIISTPLVFLLSITVPVVETIESSESRIIDYFSWWSRPLITIQFLLLPYFAAFAAKAIDQSAGSMPIWAICIIVSFILSLLVFFTTVSRHPPKYYILFAVFGFVTAIMWIYQIANELVAILEVLGATFGISKALLGLTVLAWGNSIGDFVSNMSVARMGYPGMAVSACFGGPLLNMLLGIGLSTAYSTLSNGEPVLINASNSLIICFVTLLIILACSMIFIPLSRFSVGRKFGALLIFIFITSTALNVTEEFLKFL